MIWMEKIAKIPATLHDNRLPRVEEVARCMVLIHKKKVERWPIEVFA